MQEIEFPTKPGVYMVIRGDGTVKTRVVYFNTALNCLYLAENVGEYGSNRLSLFRPCGYRWFGPVELPAELAGRLDENFCPISK